MEERQTGRDTAPLRGLLKGRTSEAVKPFSLEPKPQVIPWVMDFHIGGKLLQVQLKEKMIVGRGHVSAGSPDVDLNRFDAQKHGVSRRHAILIARKRFLTIRDLNSKNGTLLNGLRLQQNQEVPLEHGDILQFGSLQAQLMYAVLPPHKRASADSDYSTLKPLLPGNGKHVLVVEDDEDVALVYQMMLRSAGYRVSIVNNSLDAGAAFLDLSPDAVVVDLHLTHDSDQTGGLEFIQTLSSRIKDLRMQIPIIVVSGTGDGSHRMQALDAGASLFLPKPVRVDELAVRVGRLIHKLQQSATQTG